MFDGSGAVVDPILKPSTGILIQLDRKNDEVTSGVVAALVFVPVWGIGPRICKAACCKKSERFLNSNKLPILSLSNNVNVTY